MSPSYSPPERLRAAALDGYASAYGASVLELDRALGAAPGPADLIDLTHGDTRAFTPPASAAHDLAAGLAENTEAYTPYRGSASVRALIAPRLGQLLGRPVDAERDLVITPGSQGGLFAALSALVSPGDVVILPDPDYFANERIVAYLGGLPHRLALRHDESGYLHIDEHDLTAAAARRPRLVLASNPNNPTGGVYGAESAAALAELAVASDCFVVLDQLYCRLLFSTTSFPRLATMPGMAERTVVLLGPSKTESMSGYRVGAAVGPPAVVDAIERVLSYASIRAAGYSQQAMRHWLDHDEEWLEERIAAHEQLRDKLVARLAAIPGVRVAPPAGSSYVFPDASASPLARRLSDAGGNAPEGAGGDDHAIAVALKKGGVLVSPGYQFGHGGRGHFRINFSQGPERLEEALDRIAAVLTG
jgi:aspartate/methionine/tyrosine aminotransferase